MVAVHYALGQRHRHGRPNYGFTHLGKPEFAAHSLSMSISAINSHAFVSELVQSAQVWSIKDKHGFPTSTNASGEVAMPFWSSEKRARSIIETVPAYSGFKPEQVPLSAFIERWLPGLKKDGLYCGLN